MNCSTPGLPVHHQLQEFTQTHVHRVSEPSNQLFSVVPFSSCLLSLPASGSFLMSWLFAQFSSVQSLSCVRLFVTPRTAAHQASLSITDSRNLPKLMSVESVMPSNHLILCRPLFLLPSIFPIIRVFFNESALCITWPKYWSFSISPSNEYSRLISLGLTGWTPCSPRDSQESSPTCSFLRFNSVQSLSHV